MLPLDRNAAAFEAVSLAPSAIDDTDTGPGSEASIALAVNCGDQGARPHRTEFGEWRVGSGHLTPAA